ncbi:MAG TPA: lantibiotic dehydratase [Kofleriaceae bacterium]|nr:lantibiotic dehydratase [Kofleriaceae bacterium]
MSGRFELGNGWGLWPWVWLRGAGFPAANVEQLGSAALAAAVDAWLAADDAVDRTRSAAQKLCQEAKADAPDHAGLRGALNRLRKGRPPVAPVGVASIDDAVDAFREAVAGRDRCRGAVQDLVGSERARVAGLVEELAREPRFREAVCWQNPAVLDNCLDKVDTGVASERNRRIRTALKYIQRYSVKNDTIGFFGPVAWGRIGAAIDGIAFSHGPDLVEHRRVYFERWPIEILADQAARDPAVFSVLRPRRRPLSWVEDDALHVPSSSPRPVTAIERFVLEHADGGLTVAELTDRAVASPDAGAADRAAVTRALEVLVAERLVELSLHVPAEVLDVEVWLRAALSEVPDSEARARLLAPLDALEAKRDRVALAAGDPEALRRAVADLEREFSSVTSGLAVKRGHGRMYAGRQLFFEDCRRALTLELGGGMLRAHQDRRGDLALAGEQVARP